MLHLKPYFLAILLSLTFLLSACGQTGDLYLPEEEAEAKGPELKPESKPESKKETSKN